MKDGNKNIIKDKILVFIMFFPICIVCGPLVLAILVVWVFTSGKNEIKSSRSNDVPFYEREDIVEMNKYENLTEAERKILPGSNLVKTGEGRYSYKYQKL